MFWSGLVVGLGITPVCLFSASNSCSQFWWVVEWKFHEQACRNALWVSKHPWTRICMLLLDALAALIGTSLVKRAWNVEILGMAELRLPHTCGSSAVNWAEMTRLSWNCVGRRRLRPEGLDRSMLWDQCFSWCRTSFSVFRSWGLHYGGAGYACYGNWRCALSSCHRAFNLCGRWCLRLKVGLPSLLVALLYIYLCCSQ